MARGQRLLNLPQLAALQKALTPHERDQVIGIQAPAGNHRRQVCGTARLAPLPHSLFADDFAGRERRIPQADHAAACRFEHQARNGATDVKLVGATPRQLRLAPQVLQEVLSQVMQEGGHVQRAVFFEARRTLSRGEPARRSRERLVPEGPATERRRWPAGSGPVPAAIR